MNWSTSSRFSRRDSTVPTGTPKGWRSGAKAAGGPMRGTSLLRERAANEKAVHSRYVELRFRRVRSRAAIGNWPTARRNCIVEYMLAMQPTALREKAGGTPAPQAAHGEEVLRQMLAAYTDGLSTPDGDSPRVRRVTGGVRARVPGVSQAGDGQGAESARAKASQGCKRASRRRCRGRRPGRRRSRRPGRPKEARADGPRPRRTMRLRKDGQPRASKST